MPPKEHNFHLPKQVFERAPVKELKLDGKNPRLAEYALGKNLSQKELIKILWDKMAVDEVALSIASSGFWEYEPLFVAVEGGEKIVIEGNRRLAAVKVLLSHEMRESVRATDLPTLSAARLASIETLPIIIIPRREDLWRFLGFKHVNGPAKWRSYAKAQYIAFVRAKTDASLEDIAVQIGDKHKTVQRLYRSLVVIEQAEKAGVYKREWAFRGQLAFSHLMTALDYEGFVKFLELSDKNEESPNPVSSKKLKELGEVCIWLWGDKRDDTPPLIESQNPNLRQLDRVLLSPPAIATLRSGLGLATAYDVSKGDDIVFSEALQDAKNALVKAQGRVSSGYKGEKPLLEVATTIADMADDLVAVMESKTNPGRTRKRSNT
jgi:hypothetical protein